MRNHGESDHHSSMTYKEMAEDVLRYADQRNIEKFTLLGHNMGGKTAMTLSCMHPDRVSSLISLDTAPLSFKTDMKTIKQTIDHLKQINELKIEGKTRKSAMDVISSHFNDVGMSNFISGNLVYDQKTDNKTVKWCVNLDAIINNFDSISGFNDDGSLSPYTGPSLFINGSYSTEKLQNEGTLPDKELLEIYKPLFPDCTVVLIEGAGHFVHNDKPLQVCTLIKDFLV
mmetsp:Transcript_16504/g.28029  ORF Transcript_16504/g.28029 Transcript_16504/m.28029 type:complete len:228 (+) Transcript_16504:349-1032(+)